MVRTKIRRQLEDFLVDELEANVSGLCRNIETLVVDDWIDFYQRLSLVAWIEEEFDFGVNSESVLNATTFRDIVDIIYQNQTQTH